MKKLLLMAFCCLFVGVVSAGNDMRTKDVKKLPEVSQRFIAKYFPNEKIAQIKVDKDAMQKRDYDVLFESGTEIDFDSNGEWKDVNCVKGTAVPSALIPAKITGHIEKEFSGKTIRSISRDKKEYELELSDGMEVKYDLNGNFIGVD